MLLPQQHQSMRQQTCPSLAALQHMSCCLWCCVPCSRRVHGWLHSKRPQTGWLLCLASHVAALASCQEDLLSLISKS